MKNLIKKLIAIITAIAWFAMPYSVYATNSHTGDTERGSTQRWTAADSADFGYDDFTVQFWVNPESLPTVNGDEWHLVNQSGGTGFAWRFFYQQSAGADKFELDTYDNVCNGDTAEATTVAYELTVGTWEHVAMVKSGTTWELFINGVSKGTGAAKADICNSTSVFRIGVSSGDANGWDGNIDDVRFYSAARTAAQILDDYNCSLVSPYAATLTAYWTLDNVATEVAGVGAATDNLTEVNTPTYVADPTNFSATCAGGGAAVITPPFWWNMF